MRGRKITTAVAGAAALLLSGGALGAQPALAAGPGETFLAGGLPLPAGAIAGGVAGYGLDGAEAIGVSADGRYVAFVATADNLHPDAPLDNYNVFRKDRTTGEVVLIGRADGAAGAPASTPGTEVRISDDGDRVAFITRASLDPADIDTFMDVYVRDVAGGRTLLATPGTSTDIYEYDLSGDGSAIAFATGQSLVGADDANGVKDVYRRRLAGGPPQLASARDGSNLAGDGESGSPAISGDGVWVAFASTATDLGPDERGGRDVFARDMTAGRTHLVSNQNGSTTEGSNGSSEGEPVIASSPGSGSLATVYIAYSSDGTDIDPADTASDPSVFLRQLSANASRLVSRADGVGASADRRAHTPSITDDGQRIAFATDAGNLGPGGGTLSAYGAYVRDMAAGRTTFVSAGHDYAIQTTLSGDGSTVAWFEQFRATPDGDLDLPGIYARAYANTPAALGPIGYVSRPPGDAPFRAPAVNADGARAGTRGVSADGRYVVFSAGSHNLPGGDGRVQQIYRRDTATGAVELVSRATGPGGAAGDRDSELPSISADGSRVAFESYAALDPADGDTSEDVYVRDLATGTTVLAGRASGADGAAPDAQATNPAISADGRHVVFLSPAANLGAPGGQRRAWVRDLAAHTTTLADRADGPGGAIADRDANAPTISGDGRLVAWQTNATNLDPADNAPAFSSDIYVRDVVAGTTRLLSRRSGLDGQKAAGGSYAPALSEDGRIVAFQSEDEAIAPEGGPWGGDRQIVARDLASGQNTLVSRAPGGAVANELSREPAIDGDGSVVAFTSTATNLLPGLGGVQRSSIFVRDAATGALSGPPAFGTPGSDPQSRAWGPSLSADGQCLAFIARGHNAITGAAGDYDTVWVHVLSGICPKPLPEARGPDRRPEDRRRATVAKPRLTKVSLLRKRFRVGKGATAITAATRAGRRGKAKKRKPTPTGTAIRFTLNARANVGIAIERKASGRKVGRQCRRATRKLRKKKPCVRWVAVGTLKRNGTAAGRRSVAFSGRIGRKALAPGSYRAVVKASNAAGSAKPATLAFTVVRR